MDRLKNPVKVFLIVASFTMPGISNATLVNNGNGLIYDTALNIAWTQDANLLGTMEKNDSNLISKIIFSNNGVIYDTPNNYINTGVHTLSIIDFSYGNSPDNGFFGLVNWWGAQAFVNYLNDIKYANFNHWALPVTPDNNSSIGYNKRDSQLGELLYNKLGQIEGSPITTNHNSDFDLFINVQAYAYWSSTEHASNPINAWLFSTYSGNQFYGYKGAIPNSDIGSSQFFAWPVIPIPTPIPSTVWLFSSILGFYTFTQRKKSK